MANRKWKLKPGEGKVIHMCFVCSVCENREEKPSSQGQVYSTEVALVFTATLSRNLFIIVVYRDLVSGAFWLAGWLADSFSLSSSLSLSLSLFPSPNVEGSCRPASPLPCVSLADPGPGRSPGL